jgi:hypothetical protein
MNTRQIQAITTWSVENGNIELNALCLKDFYHYFFDGGSGQVSYTIQSNGLDIISGNVEIPSIIVQQWGESDEIIFSYVASTLNLTIIPVAK